MSVAEKNLQVFEIGSFVVKFNTHWYRIYVVLCRVSFWRVPDETDGGHVWARNNANRIACLDRYAAASKRRRCTFRVVNKVEKKNVNFTIRFDSEKFASLWGRQNSGRACVGTPPPQTRFMATAQDDKIRCRHAGLSTFPTRRPIPPSRAWTLGRWRVDAAPTPTRQTDSTTRHESRDTILHSSVVSISFFHDSRENTVTFFISNSCTGHVLYCRDVFTTKFFFLFLPFLATILGPETVRTDWNR